MTLLRWLTFLLASQTVISTVLLLWIYLFLLMLVSHCIAYGYSCADWDDLCDHLRDAPWEGIFKLCASASTHEFCEWFQVGTDVYIPHRKYQVKPHLSLWFSAACAAAIVHRNHFFHLYQKNKSSESKKKV